MKRPGLLQKLLQGCFGHVDELRESEPKDSRNDADNVRPAILKIPDQPAQEEPHREAVIAESSRTASERQQSDQSHSDAIRSETQPTSVESSSKIDSDADEITTSKSVPPAPEASADPDAIMPVEPPKAKYVSVKEALEDRRKLYERLRRKPDGESPSAESPATNATAVSTTDGKKPEAKNLGSS